MGLRQYAPTPQNKLFKLQGVRTRCHLPPCDAWVGWGEGGGGSGGLPNPSVTSLAPGTTIKKPLLLSTSPPLPASPAPNTRDLLASLRAQNLALVAVPVNLLQSGEGLTPEQIAAGIALFSALTGVPSPARNLSSDECAGDGDGARFPMMEGGLCAHKKSWKRLRTKRVGPCFSCPIRKLLVSTTGPRRLSVLLSGVCLLPLTVVSLHAVDFLQAWRIGKLFLNCWGHCFERVFCCFFSLSKPNSFSDRWI